MATDRLGVIGWLFVAILATGVCMIFAGKFLHMPLAIVHKLLSVLCLVLLLRSAGTLRAIQAPPALPAAIVFFALAYLASFVTGAIQSIPACASTLWLNLHRASAVIAAISCAVAARFIAIVVRS